MYTRNCLAVAMYNRKKSCFSHFPGRVEFVLSGARLLYRFKENETCAFVSESKIIGKTSNSCKKILGH